MRKPPTFGSDPSLPFLGTALLVSLVAHLVNTAGVAIDPLVLAAFDLYVLWRLGALMKR